MIVWGVAAALVAAGGLGAQPSTLERRQRIVRPAQPVQRAADSVIGMGGLPDSCYMWRRGGALDRLRGPDDPLPTLER